MVNNMLRLKIGLNLVVLIFTISLYVESVSDCSYFCEIWTWLPSKMAEKMIADQEMASFYLLQSSF